MKISYSPYRLLKQQPLNSKDHGEYKQGALIRVQSDDGFWGVADLCPWPSLGDLSWQQEILQSGPLFQRSLQLAEEDLQARRTKISFCQNEITFQNNELILVDESPDFDFVNQLKKYSGRAVKVKADQKINKWAHWLNQIDFAIQLRLDFNSCLTAEEFTKFLNLLKPSALSCIEYIEDPTVFDSKSWIIWNQQVPLAIDFQSDWAKVSYGNQVMAFDWLKKNREAFQTLILKPTRQNLNWDWQQIATELNLNLVLTSAMDHPVGLAHGLRLAQNFIQKKVSVKYYGFLTLHLYEPTEFHQNFIQQDSQLKFSQQSQSDFGIGMTKQLSQLSWLSLDSLFDFASGASNRLLLNPRLAEEEKQSALFLKQQFEKKYSARDYFLVPSSGSSQKKEDSVKVVALPRASILNSAERFNQYYQATSSDAWGLVLPCFHVAGLGVLARAYLAQSTVFQMDWDVTALISWLEKNEIHFLSLVPSQIFDIASSNLKAPQVLKKVFVGAGALNSQLQARAIDLGWPLVETYGMTETCSMIAVKDSFHSQKEFQVLPGIEVKVEPDSEVLQIRCNSLLTESIQLQGSQTVFIDAPRNGWLTTQDRVAISRTDSHFFLKFLGRKTEYIKILGEGVSLSELRSQLENLAFDLKISTDRFVLLPWPDPRSEYKMILVVDVSVPEEQIDRLKSGFDKKVRPYEKIQTIYRVEKIPRTDLGKIKIEVLKQIISDRMKG